VDDARGQSHRPPTPRADFALAAGMATGGASRLAPELLLAIFRPIRRIALDPALAPSMMKSRGRGRALMFNLAKFALWAKEIEAAERGDLEPLIKALRSDKPIPQEARKALAHLFSQVSKIKFRRPTHRARAVGATARLFMHWRGGGLRLWTADRDVQRIKAAWKNPAAAKELANSDPDLWAAASQNNITRTVSKAVELAAAYRGLNERKLTNYRRRGPKDRRRS
jgi:hypothetical protein